MLAQRLALRWVDKGSKLGLEVRLGDETEVFCVGDKVRPKGGQKTSKSQQTLFERAFNYTQTVELNERYWKMLALLSIARAAGSRFAELRLTEPDADGAIALNELARFGFEAHADVESLFKVIRSHFQKGENEVVRVVREGWRIGLAVPAESISFDDGVLDALCARLVAPRGETAASPQVEPAHSPPSTSSHVLPPNNLPPRRAFVGREPELAAIETAFAALPRASLTGLGGIGKSTVALEYAYRAGLRGMYPGGIWWVGAERQPVDALVRLARALRVVAPPPVRSMVTEAMDAETSAGAWVRAVLLALQNHREPSLVVIDNIDDEGWAAQYPGGLVRVLATTRDERLAIGKRLKLDVLRADEARALTCLHVAEPTTLDERAAFDRVVVDELGALPVAVEMAARAIGQWAHTWSEYERHLEREAETLLEDEELRGEGYPHGALSAIDLSIGRCPPGSPARRLLEAIGAFAPEAVPFAWAVECSELEPGGLELTRAFSVLKGLGLVRHTLAAVSLHRLVHRRARALTGVESWTSVRTRMVKCVVRAILRPPVPARMAEEEAFRPHLDEALLVANDLAAHDVWIAIAHRLGTHLHRCALFEEAQLLFEKALDLAMTMQPSHPELIATSQSNLALLLRDVGRLDRALDLERESLAIAEQQYGPEHPKVTKRISNVATILQELGRSRESLPLLARALAVCERQHGEFHPKVATMLSNLAAALRGAGQAEAAKQALERAVGILEATHGPEHPDVAMAINNLAMVLRDVGENRRAQTLLERALAIDTAVHGPRHPRVVAMRLSLDSIVVAEADDKPLPMLEDVADAAPPSLPRIAWPLESPASVVYSTVPSSNLATAFLVAKRGPQHPMTGAIVSQAADLMDFRVGDAVQRMRWVPPGSFMMGSPDGEAGRFESESPQHEVEIQHGLWLADTPVTQALWEAVMGNNPSMFKSPDRPVERVCWYDCQEFLWRLNELVPELEARLPSEAEWEYACRVGTKTATWLGDLQILGKSSAPLLDSIAWYGGNCGVDFELERGSSTMAWEGKQYEHTKGGTHPVQRKLPNPLGLFDMLGNVYEWCEDWMGPYDVARAIDPRGPRTGSGRVIRGGSWDSDARGVRAAIRSALDPSNRSGSLGFRLARGQGSSQEVEPRTAGGRSRRP